MQINTNGAAQSKVTDKQIGMAMKEAQDGLKMYGDSLRVIRVIQSMVSAEYGKKLTKRFTDKVKAALPDDSISIIYPCEGKMEFTVNNGPRVSVEDRVLPDYINSGQKVHETFEMALQHYINGYEQAVKEYEITITNLPGFAAAYNAKIEAVIALMQDVPVIHGELSYRLPLMYFHKKA